MNTVTIAIDPGRQGAMAVRYPNGLINVQTLAKISFADYLDALTDILEAAATEGWTVESVFEIPPKTLGRRVPESAAMTFGWHCGQLYGAVRALKIPVRDVRPPTPRRSKAAQRPRSATTGTQPASCIRSSKYPSRPGTLCSC